MDYIVKVYKDWKLHSQFQEIVQDMEDDYMYNEKQSIRESARSLKKYGSTCNHMRNTEHLIRHEIEKTDTLQGIALKYGCTTEQIRRANRLFASDSLFLRQFLFVPVERTSPFYQKPDDSIFPSTVSVRPYSIAGDLLVNTEETSEQSSHSNTKTSKSLDSVATMSQEEENRKCINDFLGKVDSTIAESRKYVEKSKELIVRQNDDDNFVTNGDQQHRRSSHLNNSYKNHNHNHNHTRHSSSGSTSDTAQLLNITQTRQVQNSLQRLEKQQDEFFEL